MYAWEAPLGASPTDETPRRENAGTKTRGRMSAPPGGNGAAIFLYGGGRRFCRGRIHASRPSLQVTRGFYRFRRDNPPWLSARRRRQFHRRGAYMRPLRAQYPGGDQGRRQPGVRAPTGATSRRRKPNRRAPLTTDNHRGLSLRAKYPVTITGRRFFVGDARERVHICVPFRSETKRWRGIRASAGYEYDGDDHGGVSLRQSASSANSQSGRMYVWEAPLGASPTDETPRRENAGTKTRGRMSAPLRAQYPGGKNQTGARR